jgi:hypothetical protein
MLKKDTFFTGTVYGGDTAEFCLPVFVVCCILKYSSGDFVFCENTGTGTRIIAIGASHVTRIIGGLADCGLDVINLAKPGWVYE